MFEIKYSNQSLKFLKKINKDLLQRLMKRLEELKIEPFSHDTKSISGYKEKMYRIRVGDYRILYEIDNQSSTIGIIKIDKRSNVYS